MLVYFALCWASVSALKRYMKTSSDFFLAGVPSPPGLRAGLHLHNLGAQEVIGMGRLGRQYGILTSHFYWIGAIPAMCFVGTS